jgi:hypothetical protein
MTRAHALAAGLALAALAPRPAAAGDGAYVLTLEPGEAAEVCKTGTLVCPAGAATCDDPAVARPEGRAQGLVFVAGKVGQTTCSAAGSSGAGMRRVFRVVVVPKAAVATPEKKVEARPARKAEQPEKLPAGETRRP